MSRIGYRVSVTPARLRGRSGVCSGRRLLGDDRSGRLGTGSCIRQAVTEAVTEAVKRRGACILCLARMSAPKNRASLATADRYHPTSAHHAPVLQRARTPIRASVALTTTACVILGLYASEIYEGTALSLSTARPTSILGQNSSASHTCTILLNAAANPGTDVKQAAHYVLSALALGARAQAAFRNRRCSMFLAAEFVKCTNLPRFVMRVNGTVGCAQRFLEHCLSTRQCLMR